MEEDNEPSPKIRRGGRGGRVRGGRRSPREYIPVVRKRGPKARQRINLTATNLLMFPKKFEWLLFLKGFTKVINITRYEEDLSLCEVRSNNKTYKFLCLIMGLSDFDFYERVQNMFTKMKKSKVLLIGSCGSLSGTGIYYISKAYQADRGFLRIDNTYVPRAAKIGAPLEPNWDLPSSLAQDSRIETAACFSSHFLNEADYMRCESFASGESSVYDMETYYYYRFCRDARIEQFACIRFVTDKVIKQSYQVVMNCLDIAKRQQLPFEQQMQSFFEQGGPTDTEEFASFYANIRKVDRLTKVFTLTEDVLDQFHNASLVIDLSPNNSTGFDAASDSSSGGGLEAAEAISFESEFKELQLLAFEQCTQSWEDVFDTL